MMTHRPSGEMDSCFPGGRSADVGRGLGVAREKIGVVLKPRMEDDDGLGYMSWEV